MKRFLIVKTSSIGDVLQSFHLIDYLKGRFPKCQINWVVEKEIAPLVRAHPEITEVLEVNTRKWRKALFDSRHAIEVFRKSLRVQNYDALFDLQGNTKSGLITCLARANKKIGYSWKTVPEKPNYFTTNVHPSNCEAKNVRQRYLRLASDYFGDEEPVIAKPLLLNLLPEEESHLERLAQLGFQRPRFMICFGANWRNKTLTEPTLKKLITLIDEKFAPSFFFIYGNEEEKAVADRLERSFSENSHAVGGLSLPLWQRFMDLVEGVIAMDSAALHLCATTHTPSFSLFGPSSALAFKPLGERHGAFQGACPYSVQFEKRCPHLRTCHSGACLRELSAEEIFEKFQSFWTT